MAARLAVVCAVIGFAVGLLCSWVVFGERVVWRVLPCPEQEVVAAAGQSADTAWRQADKFRLRWLSCLAADAENETDRIRSCQRKLRHCVLKEENNEATGGGE